MLEGKNVDLNIRSQIGKNKIFETNFYARFCLLPEKKRGFAEDISTYPVFRRTDENEKVRKLGVL